MYNIGDIVTLESEYSDGETFEVEITTYDELPRSCQKIQSIIDRETLKEFTIYCDYETDLNYAVCEEELEESTKMDYKRIYEEMNIDWYTSAHQSLEAIFKQAEKETNKKFKKINIYIEKAFYGYSMSETDYYILVSDPASYDDDFENAEPTRKCDLATDFLRDEIIQNLMKAGLDSTYDNEYKGYEVSGIRTDRDNDVGYAFSVTLTDEAKEANGFNKKGIKD